MQAYLLEIWIRGDQNAGWTDPVYAFRDSTNSVHLGKRVAEVSYEI